MLNAVTLILFGRACLEVIGIFTGELLLNDKVADGGLLALRSFLFDSSFYIDL